MEISQIFIVVLIIAHPIYHSDSCSMELRLYHVTIILKWLAECLISLFVKEKVSFHYTPFVYLLIECYLSLPTFCT